jgi:GNAT superfamily N-acetyltransferase
MERVASDSFELSWHDRSPDFFAFYRHVSPYPAIHFVAEDGSGQILGMMGLIRRPVPGDERGHLFYITDFFVDPHARARNVGHALVLACHEYVLTREGGVTLYAVENSPGVLSGTERMTRRLGYVTDRNSCTRLFECVTGGFTRSSLCETKPLNDFSDHEFSRWVERSGVAPVAGLKEQWLRLDPGAIACIARGSKAGVLSLNLEAVRKIRLTPRTQRLMNKKDSLVAYQTLTLPWWEPGAEAELANAVHEAGWHAQQNGSAMAGVRGLPDGAAAHLASFTAHSRQILHLTWAGSERSLAGGIAMDAAFL